MGENSSLTATCNFKGIEHVVSMVVKGENELCLHVENQESREQWLGSFNNAYIEDLSHKTGNFKQFNIFVNMLESALTKSSDSVTLDLLTYGDLETLRYRKQRGQLVQHPSFSSSLQESKRFLIMTYTVEFDRIHYPLPLVYQGELDNRHLLETIRKLRAEIFQLKQAPRVAVDADFLQLKHDYKVLLQEKRVLEDKLEMRRSQTDQAVATREIKLLKEMIKSLEEELLQERNQRHRTVSKYSTENRRLTEEVEDLQSRERALQIRLKNLTTDLAQYRRGKVHQNSSRHSSVDGSDSGKPRTRQLSALVLQRPPPKRRTPSSSGGRFDPTAYVREKKRKARLAQQKRMRSPSLVIDRFGVRRSISPAISTGVTKSRSWSVPTFSRGSPSPAYSRTSASCSGQGLWRSRTSSVGSSCGSLHSQSSLNSLKSFPRTSTRQCGSSCTVTSSAEKQGRLTRNKNSNDGFNSASQSPRNRLQGSLRSLKGSAEKIRRGRLINLDDSAELDQFDKRLKTLQAYINEHFASL